MLYNGKKTNNTIIYQKGIRVYKGLSPKDTITLRLLTEEVLALMRAIAGNVNGEFWLEDQDGVYELHLLVRTLVDEKIRRQLLSASSSGKNEATSGFMGKIRSFFEPSPAFRCFPRASRAARR